MWAIALLTIRRLREPAFVIVFAIGCILAWAAAGSSVTEVSTFTELPNGTASDSRGILVGTLVLVALAGVISLFFAASDVPRDIDSKMISIYLTKPISRLRYLWGKFLGVLIAGFGFCVIWLTLLLIVRAATTDAACSLSLVADQFSFLLVLLPITAMAICTSCYVSAIPAMAFSSAYVGICFCSGVLPFVMHILPGADGAGILLLYLLLPNLCYFARAFDSPAMLAVLVAYCLSVTSLFILLGSSHFNTRDIC